MAIEKCKECGKEVSSSARICPHCGKTQGRWGAGKRLLLGFGVITAVLLVRSSFSPSGTGRRDIPKTSTSSASTNANVYAVPKNERTYLGAAGSYLKTANEQGTLVARTMAGASSGSSTLDDIREALSSAQRIESAGYEEDYRHRINGNIPKNFTGIANNINETHRLFQSAMGEYLSYWNDQQEEHISRGSRTLTRCIKLMNATIAKFTASMSHGAKDGNQRHSSKLGS